MNNVIYTIGYSGYKIDEFLKTIGEYNISTVIDVRSVPYSKYFSDYNRNSLEKILHARNVYYRNYAKEFGAQQENKDFYTADGYLDFEKFAESDEFASGIEKIKAGMNMGYSFVLMCAEKDPFNCHRGILVARGFADRLGYTVLQTSKRVCFRIKIMATCFYRSQKCLFKRTRKETTILGTKCNFLGL